MKSPSRRLGTLAAALAVTTLLGACAPLLIGGAMVGGALVATDRRTSGAQLEDQAIELKAGQRARDHAGLMNHINVTSYNRQLLLTGEVATDNDRINAGRAAATVENVRSVVNELAVMPPTSLSERSSDTLLTTKVKTSLLDAKDLMANSIKVVTERGTVYLMGIVSEREANRATEIARGVENVRKVVRVFEIVSESELAGSTPRQAPVESR